MSREPTREALQRAFDEMRRRPAFSAWPAELDLVLADPVRRRLVHTEALHPRPSRAALQPAPCVRAARPARPASTAWPHAPPPALDRKRAASGERLDDDGE